MASTTTTSLQSFAPFTKNRSSSNSNSNRRTGLRVRAMRRDKWNGRMVDENMIILRKRIHEMKMMEADFELPKEWMDWEKGVYASYDSIIFDAIGHLQSYLMETRPSLVLSVIVLLTLSVPTSAAVVICNLLGFSTLVLSGIIHLG